jgi:hypothetical protein
MKKYTSLLQIHIRGLSIQAQSGECGVVDLVVGAQEQHKGIWRRIRQHFANALFRAADACHPSQNHWPIRVVEHMVGTSSVKNSLPNRAPSNVRHVWPIHGANGDAYYKTLLTHEGVKRHNDGRPVSSQLLKSCGQQSTDDFHVHISPEIQPWDGVPRLHNWLATVLGKDNTAPLSKHGEALLLNIAKRDQLLAEAAEKVGT